MHHTRHHELTRIFLTTESSRFFLQFVPLPVRPCPTNSAADTTAHTLLRAKGRSTTCACSQCARLGNPRTMHGGAVCLADCMPPDGTTRLWLVPSGALCNRCGRGVV